MSSWQRRAWGELLTSHVILLACGSLALLLVLLFGFSCSDSDESQAAPFATDTVLMIVLEGVSPEDLTRYALQSDKMPALAQFAKESTWFDRHWAQSNGKNAAFASLLSGLYSSKHGLGSVMRIGRDSLSSEVTLVSEDLSAAGFDCIASVSTQTFSSVVSGFDQGWSKYASSDFVGRQKVGVADEVVDAVWDDFATGLSGSTPIFGLFEFDDALRPQLAPDRFVAPALIEHLALFENELSDLHELLEGIRTGSDGNATRVRSLLARRRGHPAWEAMNAAYQQAQFQFLDEQFGRMFDLLKKHDRYQDALIVVTGNHGRYAKGPSLVQGRGQFDLDELRVPLLLRLPGGVRTKAVQELTQAVDVRATIAEALGLPCNDSDGVSLLGLFNGLEPRALLHECVLFEDSSLGIVGAVDDFWLVQGRRGNHFPLDPSLTELTGESIPPVPKARLERTRKAVAGFIGEPHVEVELTPGSKARYTIDIGPTNAGWQDGNLFGTHSKNRIHMSRLGGTEEPAWGSLVCIGARAELFAEELDGERSGFELWSGAEPAVFGVIISVDEGELDETKLRFGDRDLAHLALPRRADQRAGEWPNGADGKPKEPVVDVTRPQGRLLNVRVGGEPGRRVRLLIVGELEEEFVRSEMVIRNPEGHRVERVAGCNASAWVEGETPFSISFGASSAWDMGLSVELDGKQVAVSGIRMLGKRFAVPGSIGLAVPSWLPGVREHLESPRDSSQDALEPGTLWIGCTSRRQFANDRPVPSHAILDRLQYLGLKD